MNIEAYKKLLEECNAKKVTLVAVSKTKPVADILALYNLGQRDFGENYVQELIEKEKQLPKDIRWHFIGHLQSNKIKQIISFVHLIHGVDSYKLLKEINKQAEKLNILSNCLLQIHIAQEETKFGLDENELKTIIGLVNEADDEMKLKHINIAGLMGMASFTDNMAQVRNEFKYLKSLQKRYSTKQFHLPFLSMGMTADYTIAIEEGSNMIRVGSLIFGERESQ
ncbi:MAG: YggS family pyridoxal phosphate-dependent enzyme [Bacteroidetes bacterium]|nr:YggS family pyridoxal phosphate-dependent enzyme [Bacteroidota bacterium]